MKMPAALPALSCLLVLGGIANANPTYVSFAVPGAFTTSPGVINSSGTVAGSYQINANWNGFVRTPDGTITTFSVNGSTLNIVYDMNDSGVTDGYYLDSGRIAHGFVRDAAGNVTSFDPAGSLATYPQLINANGDIAGNYYYTGFDTQGFIRTGADGSIVTFQVAGATSTTAVGINASDTVCGNYSNGQTSSAYFRTSDGTVTSFAVAGSRLTQPSSINDAGVISGQSTDSNWMVHGFVRAPDGTITVFDPPGSTGTYPALAGLNQNGDVSGYYSLLNSRGKTIVASFIRYADGTITTYTYPRDNYRTNAGGLNGADATTGNYTKRRRGATNGFLRTP